MDMVMGSISENLCEVTSIHIGETCNSSKKVRLSTHEEILNVPLMPGSKEHLKRVGNGRQGISEKMQ